MVDKDILIALSSKLFLMNLDKSPERDEKERNVQIKLWEQYLSLNYPQLYQNNIDDLNYNLTKEDIEVIQSSFEMICRVAKDKEIKLGLTIIEKIILVEPVFLIHFGKGYEKEFRLINTANSVTIMLQNLIRRLDDKDKLEKQYQKMRSIHVNYDIDPHNFHLLYEPFFRIVIQLVGEPDTKTILAWVKLLIKIWITITTRKIQRNEHNF